MTTTLLLIRHGQTNSNVSGLYAGWSEENLNELGYIQAHRLSYRLAHLPIAAIYASPINRAYTTAAIIAEPHQLNVEVLDELIEIQLGDWEGIYQDEIKRRWPRQWQQSRTDPTNIVLPNGESFEQVTTRAIRALNTVILASQDKQVVIVTHEVIVKVLVAYALGVTNSIYRRIEIDNASLSVLQITDSNYQLVRLNDTSHLEARLYDCLQREAKP